MKKIFTLCAAAAVAATSALAVNAAKSPASFQISEEAMSRIMAQPAQYVDKADSEKTFYNRSWTDQQGNSWTLSMSKREPCYFLTSEGAPMEGKITDKEALAELPLWFCEAGISVSNAQGKTLSRVALGLFWPCYSYWNNSMATDSLDIVSPEDFAKGSTVINGDGSATNVPTCKSFVKRGNYFLTEGDNGWFSAYGFMNLRFSADELCTINGKVIPSMDGKVGYADGSSLIFDDVENDIDGIIYTIPVNLSVTGEGQSGTLAGQYVGSIRQTLTPSHYAFNIGNVTLFYMGNKFDAIEDEDNRAMYWGDWGPLAKYYYAISTPQLLIYPQNKDANGTEVTSGPFDMNKLGNYRTSDEGVPESAFTYIRGVVFAEPGTGAMDKFSGKYEVVKPEESKTAAGVTVYRITPAANMAIPSIPRTAAYASVPNGEYRDGMSGVWQRYFFYPQNPSQLSFGTPKGLYVYLIDENGSTYRGSYEGSIMYAKNANNMYEMTEIPAIGTENYDGVENVNVADEIVVNAANGAINVLAPEAALVEVYALNGAKVASVNAKANELVRINAANGMYVVKAGNKTAKVIL